jgi:hypothetical protein
MNRSLSLLGAVLFVGGTIIQIFVLPAKVPFAIYVCQPLSAGTECSPLINFLSLSGVFVAAAGVLLISISKFGAKLLLNPFFIGGFTLDLLGVLFILGQYLSLLACENSLIPSVSSCVEVSPAIGILLIAFGSILVLLTNAYNRWLKGRGVAQKPVHPC